MSKYYLEGDVNFFDELQKMLTDTDENKQLEDDYNNKCCITNLPLDKKYVKLDCNHCFNYIPLYKEIFSQKFIYKNYHLHKEPKDSFKKLKTYNYYIKCPYCRNLQSNLLNYYPELGLAKIYGINSSSTEDTYHEGTQYFCGGTHPSCIEIKDFICCKNSNNYCFQYKKSYCYQHYKVALRDIRQKSSQLKKDLISMKKIIKENTSKKKKVEKQGNPPVVNIKTSISKNISQNVIDNTCKEILKTGINKGNVCNRSAFKDGCCKRHYKIVDENPNMGNP